MKYLIETLSGDPSTLFSTLESGIKSRARDATPGKTPASVSARTSVCSDGVDVRAQ